MDERSIFIAGAAGEGIQTVGDVVARAFLTHGYPVFAMQEYESRIRGGYSSHRLRIAAESANSPRRDADVLLALNPEARDHYASDLRIGGTLVASEAADEQTIVVPFRDLALEHGGSSLYANAVAAGALAAVLGLPVDTVVWALTAAVARHGNEAVVGNISAAEAGFAVARDSLGEHAPKPWPKRENVYAFVSAHDVIPLAAAAAGCRFMSAYPMSPSTGIITAFARDPELGVFVEQAEDEIAAIGMALGASAAGARAMTATSGGGFALMVESISLAGMIETPIVIVLSQRPGPATGLPTRTAQEDLLFAIHAGHGETPRAVLAPADPLDALQKTLRAFELADRYQIPAIVLSDQFLADSRFSLPPLSLPDGIADAHLADPDAIDGEYRRYARTGDGVSPRLYLGQTKNLVYLDSDEHTEDGHITEDLRIMRPSMVEKRLEKGRRLRCEIAPPSRLRDDDAEILLLGWGSTKGAIDEAVTLLRGAGRRVGALHFTELWPLPEMTWRDDIQYWTVEGNATGQLARLLGSDGGPCIEGRIGRYDGLPLDAATIVEALT